MGQTRGAQSGEADRHAIWLTSNNHGAAPQPLRPLRHPRRNPAPRPRLRQAPPPPTSSAATPSTSSPQATSSNYRRSGAIHPQRPRPTLQATPSSPPARSATTASMLLDLQENAVPSRSPETHPDPPSEQSGRRRLIPYLDLRSAIPGSRRMRKRPPQHRARQVRGIQSKMSS